MTQGWRERERERAGQLVEKLLLLLELTLSNDCAFSSIILLFEFEVFSDFWRERRFESTNDSTCLAGLPTLFWIYLICITLSPLSFTHNMSSRLREPIDLDYEFADAQDDSDEGNEWPQSSPDYPERGLWPETKALLIDELDLKGGFEKITRASKLLESICDEYPEDFGHKETELRKRVKTIVSHWKRSAKLFAAARKDAATLTVTHKAPRASTTTTDQTEPTTRSSAPTKKKRQEKQQRKPAVPTTMSNTPWSSPGCKGRKGGVRKHKQIGKYNCFV